MDFTIAYNTEPRKSELFAEYILTFDTPNGERRTLWLIADIDELRRRVLEWDNNPPIKDYLIKTIEQIEPRRINPVAESALIRMGYIGEPGQ